MAQQNSQSVILFGSDISQEPQEGGSSGGGGGGGGDSGGGGQGCSSTLLQQQQKPEKEKSHINEGCSSMVVQNCVSKENNNNLTKRKRPVEDVIQDHQQRSDATSELTQQQNHRNRDRDRIFLINKTRKLQHEAGGASSSSSSKNTTHKFINEILKKNGVYSNSNNNNCNNNQTVVVVVPRREQNLFVESSTNRTPQQQQNQQQQPLQRQRLVAMRIESFRNYTPEEEEEERRRGVTTWLQLYSDPWKIKKKLTMSDLSRLSRFLIPANLVENHVKPFMVKAGLFDQVETSEGLRVYVWDVETKSEHKMVLKLWNSSGSFNLIGRWVPEFVHRRSLKEGDEVGFLWESYGSRFLFKVLSRARNPIH